jgi:hypothetical protein
MAPKTRVVAVTSMLTRASPSERGRDAFSRASVAVSAARR